MSDIISLRDRVKNFNASLEALRGLQASVDNQLSEASRDLDDRKNVQNVLRLMSEKLSQEGENVTEKIISLGLKDAFFDEDLSLEVEHSISHGKPAIKLLLCDNKRKVKGDPVKSFGGGPTSLIGVLLRVLSIVRHPHMARLLILDEPLIQVSAKYKNRAAAILRKLCDPVEEGGLGFSILVISHDEVYKKNAKHSYLATLDEDGESLLLSKQTIINEEIVDESE